jgi:hypothetical protein
MAPIRVSFIKIPTSYFRWKMKYKHFVTHCLDPVNNGKAVPLQAWSGTEGSRKLRFPDFMTTAQVDGEVVSLTHRLPLPQTNTPGTHFC